MKSAEALIQEQLAMARDAAIAQMLSLRHCTPVAAIANLPIDPWGTAINYQTSNATQLTAPTATSCECGCFSDLVGGSRIGSVTPGRVMIEY